MSHDRSSGAVQVKVVNQCPIMVILLVAFFGEGLRVTSPKDTLGYDTCWALVD